MNLLNQNLESNVLALFKWWSVIEKVLMPEFSWHAVEEEIFWSEYWNECWMGY